LWESWHSPEDSEIRTCTILTTEANELLAPIHNRIPMILGSEDYELWLDTGVREVELLSTLLKPYSSNTLEAYPVSRRVNSSANNEPSCIKPVAQA
jgi:putative SOS response-associated peptidase YedK